MKDALAALEAGHVVAIATESFFGLLADASRTDALDVLFSLKPRGSDKGVPLVLPDRDSWLGLVGAVPPAARALADAFWPGGLSIALPCSSSRPIDPRLALEGRIAVRLPGASPAAELARAFGKPLTATSANLPGAPPATTAEQVLASFPEPAARGLLSVVPGRSAGGAPSTLVVLEERGARIVRNGAVAAASVASVLRGLGITLAGQG